MKTGKLSFGFSTVNSGQRNANLEPQVIAVSTEGGFRITPVVSRVLGIAPGEYVMFLNNAIEIDNAIASKHPDIVKFCEEQGLDITAPETATAIHKEFDMWAVAKGITEFDTKGNYKTVSERLTMKDKKKYVEQHYDELLESALETIDNEEHKEILSNPDSSREEIISVMVEYIQPKEVEKVKGSKTANPAGLTGVGVGLNFTDTNVWNQLKSDLEDKTSVNRVFTVDIEDIQEVVVNDGYKDVTVRALVLESPVDKEPSRINSKSEE